MKRQGLFLNGLIIYLIVMGITACHNNISTTTAVEDALVESFSLPIIESATLTIEQKPYPNGTRYECYFSGKFTSLKRIGQYEYSMKCESLIAEGNVGDEEIIEGVRVVTAGPHGLDQADEFLLYLPERKIFDLPEKFLLWVRIDPEMSHQAIIDPEIEDRLTFYGLYNVGGETGFTGYELVPEYEITQTLYQELRAGDGVLLARNEFNQPVFGGSSVKANQMNEAFKEDLIGVDLSDFDWVPESYDSRDGYTYNEAQQGRVAGYLVDWEESYRKHQYISFIGTYEWDGLGAHGGFAISGRTFNVITGEEISLADIMKIPADILVEKLYQEYVSYHVSLGDGKDILAQGHMESLNDGSFQQYYIDSVKAQCGEDAVFWLTDDGVHIFFEQYTFFYAAGLSELIIPYTRDDLLKAEFAAWME